MEVILALCKGLGKMLTFPISWLPNRSIFLLNLRLSHVADTADCVNQITAHDSGNFSIPPLLTFTRAIYRLLKLPLPPSNPRGIPARGGTLLCEQMPSFRREQQSLSSILQRQPPTTQTTRVFKLRFAITIIVTIYRSILKVLLFLPFLLFKQGGGVEAFFTLIQSPGSLSIQI